MPVGLTFSFIAFASVTKFVLMTRSPCFNTIPAAEKAHVWGHFHQLCLRFVARVGKLELLIHHVVIILSQDRHPLIGQETSRLTAGRFRTGLQDEHDRVVFKHVDAVGKELHPPVPSSIRHGKIPSDHIDVGAFGESEETVCVRYLKISYHRRQLHVTATMPYRRFPRHNRQALVPTLRLPSQMDERQS